MLVNETLKNKTVATQFGQITFNDKGETKELTAEQEKFLAKLPGFKHVAEKKASKPVEEKAEEKPAEKKTTTRRKRATESKTEGK